MILLINDLYFMKKQLQLWFSSLMLLCALGIVSAGYAQVNYSENFNDDEGGWDDFDFYSNEFLSCHVMDQVLAVNFIILVFLILNFLTPPKQYLLY